MERSATPPRTKRRGIRRSGKRMKGIIERVKILPNLLNPLRQIPICRNHPSIFFVLDDEYAISGNKDVIDLGGPLLNRERNIVQQVKIRFVEFRE